MTTKYTLDKKTEQYYAGMLVLSYMVSTGRKYSSVLEGDLRFIEPVLKQLFFDDLLLLNRGTYEPSIKGRQVVDKLRQQYTEFQDMLNVYCCVDLSAEAKAAQDQFAYQKFYDDAFQDDAVWNAYVNLPRWTDLRIAVAEFKNINPLDVVFLSFLKKGKFDTTKPGWETELALGDIWNEMLDVCNTAWHVEDLAYKDEAGQEVPGGECVKLIVEQGTALMFELIKLRAEIDSYQKAQAEQAAASSAAVATETQVVTETIVEEYTILEPVVYYDPWWDPYYVSPLWTVGLWILL